MNLFSSPGSLAYESPSLPGFSQGTAGREFFELLFADLPREPPVWVQGHSSYLMGRVVELFMPKKLCSVCPVHHRAFPHR